MSPPTFLIVDDDAIIRVILRQTVARHDPHAVVYTAASVAEAHQLLAHTTPDIVMTDCHLTNGIGLDVLAAHGCVPPPKVMVISGDLARKEASLAAGAVAFLAKPFTPTDLLELLRTSPHLAAP